MLRFSAPLVALLALAGTARAQSPSTPAPAQSRGASIQAGTWDLQLVMGGGTLEATLTITITGDSLNASVHVGDHASPVRATERRGNRLVLESPSTGTQVRYELEFRGDLVTGTFTYEGTPGPVTGRRRAGSR